MEQKKQTTSWQSVHDWYDTLVGDAGHYYHKAIVLPKTIELLRLQTNSSLLDLACGQGVLARAISKEVAYTGIDISKDLIRSAEKQKMPGQRFLVGDVTKKLPLQKEQLFSHATIILALQNMEHPREVFLHLRPYMRDGGRLVIVLNHPCFRIPRQSHWGIDAKTKTQYRRLNLYMTPQSIPIQAHPGKNKAVTTLSFHHPLSAYFHWLQEAGFVVETLEEWCSDKISSGEHARMENRARKEFPLFLALSARSIPFFS